MLTTGLTTGLPAAFLAGLALAAGLEAFSFGTGLAAFFTAFFTTFFAAFIVATFTGFTASTTFNDFFGFATDLPEEAFFAVFVLAIVGTLLQVRQDVAGVRKRINPQGAEPCFWKGRTLPDSIWVCHNSSSAGALELIIVHCGHLACVHVRFGVGNSCSSINTCRSTMVQLIDHS